MQLTLHKAVQSCQNQRNRCLAFCQSSNIKIIQSMNLNYTYLLLLLTYLPVTLSEITQTHLDIPASLNMANVNLLTRVDKIMDIDYAYRLVYHAPEWHQYPEMKTVFTLPFSQYVKFNYNIAVGCSHPAHLGVRVKIDGVEVRRMRGYIAAVLYPRVFLDVQHFLQKGTHTAMVQYQANCDSLLNPGSSTWQVAYFQVSFYEPGV